MRTLDSLNYATKFVVSTLAGIIFVTGLLNLMEAGSLWTIGLIALPGISAPPFCGTISLGIIPFVYVGLRLVFYIMQMFAWADFSHEAR